ncbi:MAG TPA: hypothetical protein VL500_01210 [Candidatus Eisenbacteria bacterium]|nr:hypothetical protein [Candidatus Eisenbacteria bacterium]
MLWPLLFSIPLFLLPLGYFIWLRVIYSRPPVTGVAVVAEYDPPADVAPIEAALLLDGTLKPRALAAAIVGLHLKGAVDLGESGGAVDAFRQGRVLPKLEPYELTILEALFSEGPDTAVKPAAERMAAATKTIENQVVAGLRKKGFLAERSLSAIILFVSAMMAALMISLSILPLLGFRAAISIFAALTLMDQFAYIAATWRPRLSGRGKEATLRLMGFKVWLTQVEGDYIQWQEKEEKRLNDYSPYAIVFGISLTWATKLQKLTGALLENII